MTMALVVTMTMALVVTMVMVLVVMMMAWKKLKMRREASAQATVAAVIGSHMAMSDPIFSFVWLPHLAAFHCVGPVVLRRPSRLQG